VGVEEADAVTGIVGARRGFEQSQDEWAPLAEFVENARAPVQIVSQREI
jgi:hypothetical protein